MGTELDDPYVTPEQAPTEAKAIYRCENCDEVLLTNGDDEADKLAYAIATNSAKERGIDLKAMQKAVGDEKRPTDVIGAAVMFARIVTGEIPEMAPRDSAAASLGRKGGSVKRQWRRPTKRWRWRSRHSEVLHDCIAACLSGLFIAVFAKVIVLTTWSEAILVWLVFSGTVYFGLRSNSN